MKFYKLLFYKKLVRPYGQLRSCHIVLWFWCHIAFMFKKKSFKLKWLNYNDFHLTKCSAYAFFFVKMTKIFSKIFEHFIFQKKFYSENSKFLCEYDPCHKKTKKLSWLCSKTKLVLKMRVFETHFLTTRWPKKLFLIGIVFFGGDDPPIAKKLLSTVLV